mmetsp:Transcript_41953/g.89560  ORF Transcript_41953/g.89560 Transcript_41953/m.89560 type:complete len:232 (+) Transcript_41953:208-903(+)
MRLPRSMAIRARAQVSGCHAWLRGGDLRQGLPVAQRGAHLLASAAWRRWARRAAARGPVGACDHVSVLRPSWPHRVMRRARSEVSTRRRRFQRPGACGRARRHGARMGRELREHVVSFGWTRRRLVPCAPDPRALCRRSLRGGRGRGGRRASRERALCPDRSHGLRHSARHVVPSNRIDDWAQRRVGGGSHGAARAACRDELPSAHGRLFAARNVRPRWPRWRRPRGRPRG